MTEALIKPELLRWARERSRLAPDSLARNVRVKPEQLESWEKGETYPTFRQVQNLARVLRVPLGYLFLSSPPEEKPALPDLRTVSNVEFNTFSVDFLDLLNDVLRKQQWYREYLRDEGAQPLGFVGRFNLTDTPEQVAEDIRYTLDVSKTLRQEAINWEDFLRKLIRNAETKNILVLRSGVVGNNPHRKLSVDEFRGFAISDDLAPLIFLNGRDAKAAQIFTLAHELAHLWLGESGISNPDIGRPSRDTNKQIEPFCNHVAAELLVPQDQFLIDWHGGISLEENLRKLVHHYRVSSLVILRRAYDLDMISRDDYVEKYKREMENQKTREGRQSEESGGDFYATLFARNSTRLTNAIVSAAFEGRLLYRDAARFLGVKVKTLESIANKLEIR